MFFMINYPGKVLLTKSSTIPMFVKVSSSLKMFIKVYSSLKMEVMVVINKMGDKSQTSTMFLTIKSPSSHKNVMGQVAIVTTTQMVFILKYRRRQVKAKQLRNMPARLTAAPLPASLPSPPVPASLPTAMWRKLEPF